MSDDLWGDLPEPDTEILPSMILQEQASVLGSKTPNVLEGVVQKHKTGDGLVVDLHIRCPVVDNYTFHVLQLRHDLLKVYPFQLNGIAKRKVYQIAEPDQLREALKDQFQSPELRRVVSALLREATSVA